MILSHFLLRAATLSWPGAVYALTTRASAAAALSALTITNIDDVRGNLHLPALDADSAPITWSSSDESVISAAGIVRRPSVDATVNLTATSTTNSTVSRTFTASVRQAVAAAAYEGYAFAYFTGNTVEGENIYIAASTGNNALQWTELNDGEPILTSTMGTKGLRDPFIMRSVEGDTFYLLATDLSIGSGTSWGDAVTTGSRYLEIWESHDLISWSAQRHVLVSPPEAGMTWAPEAFWDAASGSYVVFWASALFDANDTEHTGTSDYHRMLISHTRDFVSFSEPTVWQDANASRIDSDVLEADGVFYRFTKDEGASGTGCSDIIMEESTNLTGTLDEWTILDSCIGRDAGTSAVEGPTSFKANAGDLSGEKYYLFVDEYGGRGYIPLQTADITKPNWTVPNSFTLPSSPRHGTVLPVTAAELSALTSAYKNTTSSATTKSSGTKSPLTTISKNETSDSKAVGPVSPGLWAVGCSVLFTLALL